MTKKLKGVVVPIVTAFDPNGDFDKDSYYRHLNYLVDNGIKGIFSLGLTGESPYLHNGLRLEIMEHTSKAVQEINASGRNIDLVVGVNGSDAHETISNIEFASSLNIDGIVLQLSLVPSIKPKSFLEEAAKASKVPIYLYSNSATALNGEEVVTPSNIKGLSEIKNVYGLKVSENLQTLKQYFNALGNVDFSLYIGNAMDFFRVFGGNEKLLHEPAGVITGPGNLFPKEWVSAWELRKQADSYGRQRVFKLFTEFSDIYYRMPSGKNTVAAIKYLLHKKGILNYPYCYANPQLSEEAKSYLYHWFKKLK